MKTIPLLKKGDTIGIVTPASRVSREKIQEGAEILEKSGFKVKFGKYFDQSPIYLAASDKERTKDVQKMLDDESVKAILFSRGGYGCVHIIDHLDFTKFIVKPKWILGFSDITLILNHLFANFKIKSVHSVMPGGFKDASPEAIQSILQVITTGKINYIIPNHPLNRAGLAKGKLIGGNLSLIQSMMGSNSFPSFNNNILFIEDIGEYIYHIDRMMQMLKRAQLLSKLSGIVVGQFSEMKDTNPTFGKKIEEVIFDAVKEYKYPVIFDFPAGHVSDNRALIIGSKTTLTVDNHKTQLTMS